MLCVIYVDGELQMFCCISKPDAHCHKFCAILIQISHFLYNGLLPLCQVAQKKQLSTIFTNYLLEVTMKINLKNILISISVATLFIGASACTASAAPAADNPSSLEIAINFGKGNDNGNGSGSVTPILAGTTSELSPEETAALLFMREEEKLARDVYNTLYQFWGQSVFQNIAASEQTHMDRIKLLLDRYNLADPALESGSFADPNLQSLHDQLIAQGSISLVEALKVGAAIEEIDILDLEERIAHSDNEDIQLVFNNLMKGSYSHLNAFTRVLFSQTGETYEPQYLTPDAYAEIINGTPQSGNRYGNSGQASGQGKNGYRGGQNGKTTTNKLNKFSYNSPLPSR